MTRTPLSTIVGVQFYEYHIIWQCIVLLIYHKFVDFFSNFCCDFSRESFGPYKETPKKNVYINILHATVCNIPTVLGLVIMPPPLKGGALSDDAVSDVCLSVYLSVAYIGPKSRTEKA